VEVILPKIRAANIALIILIRPYGQCARLSEDGSKNPKDIGLQFSKGMGIVEATPIKKNSKPFIGKLLSRNLIMEPKTGVRPHELDTPMAHVSVQIDAPDGKPISEAIEELIEFRVLANGAMEEKAIFPRRLDGQKEIPDAIIKFTD
jgi:hypothetical protein